LVASIFALFGEQFATQFASESLTWIDHLVFAMVPLGILTMITGAIRVSGPRIARSFIGRARENRALAEIELMSSTSGEVCELFNGKSIIRATGTPKLAQFLVFPESYRELENGFKDFDTVGAKPLKDAKPPADTSCGIHSVLTAVTTEDGARDKPLMECVRMLYRTDFIRVDTDSQQHTTATATSLSRAILAGSKSPCVPTRNRHRTLHQRGPTIFWALQTCN
jgi:hypothetical protein